MRRLLLLVILVSLSAGCMPPGQTDESAEKSTAELRREKTVELFRQAPVTGMSITYIHQYEPDPALHLGLSNVESGDPVDDGTVFEAASLSKPVFAYIFLKHVDMGVVDLDTPLLEYVDDRWIIENFFEAPIDDPRFRQITARMVLSHRTGLPNWRFFDGPDAPLTFRRDPGLQFGYSGEGFVFAQRVLEHVTGSPLELLAQEHVFLPFGMEESSYELRSDLVPSLAVRTDLLGTAVPMPEDFEYKASAAASLLTTTSDYARFLIAIAQGRGLSREVHQSLFTPQVKVSRNEEDPIYWGLGIGLTGDGPDSAIWHWGDNGDMKAFAWFSRSSNNGLVMFANDALGLSVFRDVVEIAGGDTSVFTHSGLVDDYIPWDTPDAQLIHMLRSEGLEAVLQSQRQRHADPDKHAASESGMNQLGYQLLRRDRIDDAIAVFSLNTELHPDSANTWDSLAEAWLKKGDTDKARQFYQKALEVDPEWENATKMLKVMDENDS